MQAVLSTHVLEVQAEMLCVLPTNSSIDLGLDHHTSTNVLLSSAIDPHPRMGIEVRGPYRHIEHIEVKGMPERDIFHPGCSGICGGGFWKMIPSSSLSPQG